MLNEGYIGTANSIVASRADIDIQSGVVVTADWLHAHLHHPQLVIIDCRFSLSDPQLGRQCYEVSHIPGACFLDLNQDLSSSVQVHGGRHPLPNPTELAAKLAKMGVYSGNGHDPTQIVVYDDSRFAFAARLWWLLRYMGHDQVAVLDGGFQGWQAAQYPVTATIPQEQAGYFVPRPRSEWVVSIDAVKTCQQSPGVVLVDSRERDRYQGVREPIDPIAGHIPGAVNYPWQDVTTDQGYLYPVEMHRRRWGDLATASEVIVYCGSGVTACVNLLSLEIAGIPNGKLYAGSWSDWCSYLHPDR